MCCSADTVRYYLGVLCVGYVLLGIMMVLTGFASLFSLSDLSVFLVQEQYYEAPYCSFIMGICLLMAAILGFCGVATEKNFLVIVHCVTIVYLLFMGIGVLVIANRDQNKVHEDLHSSMYILLQRFWENSDVGDIVYKGWTELQLKFHCCGVHNYTNWLDATKRQPFLNVTHRIPPSCCITQVAGCSELVPFLDKGNSSGNIFIEGCFPKVYSNLKMKTILTMMLSFEGMGSFGVILSALLIWKWRANPFL